MTTYEVVGIGNAVVDVISHADDSFLDHMGIEKGIMQLIERERGEVLYAAMEDRLQTPRRVRRQYGRRGRGAGVTHCFYRPCT